MFIAGGLNVSAMLATGGLNRTKIYDERYMMNRTEQCIKVYIKGSQSSKMKKYLPILGITTISALAIVLSTTSILIPINQAATTASRS